MRKAKRRLLDDSGFTISQTLVGMGIGSVALLASMQMASQSFRMTQGVQASTDFTSLVSAVTQLVMTQEVCKKVLEGSSFDPAVNDNQNVVLKKPDGTGEFLSTQVSPFQNSLKITQLALKPITGASGRYMAQLNLQAEKKGQVLGGKHLSSTLMLNLNVDEASRTVVGCSGGGDFIQRSGDTLNGPLLLPAEAPTDPRQAVSKSFVESMVDAAGGGGGGSCFETTAASCGPNYVQQATQTRNHCVYATAGGGVMAIDTLGPCVSMVRNKFPNDSFNSSHASYYYTGLYYHSTPNTFTTRICCKP